MDKNQSNFTLSVLFGFILFSSYILGLLMVSAFYIITEDNGAF